MCICLILLMTPTASAATLGPATDYDELLALCEQAGQGDVILVSGELTAADRDALVIQSPLRISSEDDAVLRGIRLHDSTVSFTNIQLLDTLTITGTSHVELGRGVSVEGAAGSSGISFSGSGELLIDPDCTITGGSGSAGVSIQHQGGEFYAGIDGVLRGGSGQTGGTGLLVSSLTDGGTMMISGRIHGGNGTAMGGNALNLYDLSGNAFITITGRLKGGEGSIGGDGAQIVSAVDNVSIGIDGQITGGQGESYGGDALMLMNIGGREPLRRADRRRRTRGRRAARRIAARHRRDIVLAYARRRLPARGRPDAGHRRACSRSDPGARRTKRDAAARDHLRGGRSGHTVHALAHGGAHT